MPAAPGGPASPTSGSRTSRRRCRSCSTPTMPSTAADAALPTSTSAPSSATWAHYSCARLRLRSPRPGRGRDQDRAGRDARFDLRGPHPRGRGDGAPPLPRPLQRLQRARRPGRRALRLGVGLEPAVAGLERTEAVFGRVETIEVAGRPVSILLIKNPAGANEVLRTLRLEAERGRGRGDRPVDRSQRQDRRRSGRLLGLGRRFRAAGRRTTPGLLRRDASCRDRGAPEIRRSAGRSGSRSCRRSPAPSIAPSPMARAASSPCPRTPPCWSCGRC